MYAAAQFFKDLIVSYHYFFHMSFDVSVSLHPDYLRIKSTGEFSVNALLELIDRVKSEALAARRNRILVDSLEITGDISDADRFLGGKRSAEVFGTQLKVAALFSAEKITKLGELAATNRGAKLLITDSESEAIDWLLES